MNIGKLNPSYSRGVDSNTILLLHLNGNILDSQSSPLALTNSATPVTFSSSSPKFSGTSYAVFGGSSWLTVPFNSNFNFGSNDFTIDCWINFPTLVNQENTIMEGMDAGTNNGWRFAVAISGGATQLEFAAFNGGGSNYMDVSYQFSTNTWYHVAIVSQHSTWTMYVNGVSIGTHAGSATGSISNAFTIGVQAPGGSSPTGGYYFNGSICELRISNIARWTSNFTLPIEPYLGREQWYSTTTDPKDVLLLHCQGANGGTNFKDSSILNLSVSNSNTTLSNTVPSPVSGLSVASFNGSNSSLSIANNNNFNFGSNDFTVEFWIYYNSLTTYASPLCFTNAGESIGWEIYVNVGVIATYLNGVNNMSTSFTWATGKWYHIAWTRNGSTFRIFINGVLQNTSTFSGSQTANSSTPLLISSAPWGSSFLNGYMAEVRITNGVCRYVANFTPGTTPYVGTDGLLPTPDSNTVLLLHGDGTDLSTNIVDSSMSQKALTVNGNASISNQGKIFFNGNNQYLSIPYNSVFQFGSNNFTIDMWVNLSTINNTQNGSNGIQCFCNTGNEPGGGGNNFAYLFRFNYNAGSPELEFYWSPNGQNPSGTAIAPWTPIVNTWYHIAAVRNGSNLYIFVNGQILSTTTITDTIYNSNDQFNIGARKNGLEQYVDGYITNFRVSNIARWTKNFNPSTTISSDANTSLLLTFKGNLTDASTHNFTVTNNNAATILYPGVLPLGNVDGGAMYFDGSTSYLQSLNNTDFQFGTVDFTIDFWVNFIDITQVNQTLFIISDNPGNGGGMRLFWNSAANSWSFLVYNAAGSGTLVSIIVADTLTNSTWYHIAVVRSGSTWTLYKNGTSIGSTSANITVPVYNNNNLDIGAYEQGPQYFLKGYLNEFRVTKGLARWTSNFTKPSIPYTDITTWFGNKIDPRDVLLIHGESLIDSSLNTKSLTNHSATISTAQKRFGNSSILFGSGQYVTAAYSPDYFVGSSPFTFECWIYPTAFPSGIMTNRTDGNNPYYLWYITGAGKLIFDYYVGGDHTLQSNATLLTNTWYHIAVSFDGVTKRQFINGVLDSTLTDATSIPDPGQAFVLGSYDPTTASRSMFGYIDEFRFTKGVCRYYSSFTPSAIPFVGTEGYSKSVDPMDVLILHFDDADGSQKFTDSSANNLLVSANGNASVLNQNLSWDSAFYNGTSAYLSVPYNSNINFTSGDFTMEAWINPSVLSVGGQAISLFSSRYTSNTNGYLLYLSNVGSVITINPLVLNSGTTIVGTAWNLPNFNVNTWNHIAFVRQGNLWSVYWNGGLVGSITASGNIGTFSTPLLIGADVYGGPTGDYFYGYMADVKFSNVARYTTSFTPLPRGSANSDVNTVLFLAAGATKDTSNTGFNITNNNVVSYPIGPAISHGGVLGVNLTTTGDYLSIANNSTLYFGNNNFTIDGWVNLQNVAVSTGMIIMFQDSSGGGMRIEWDGTGFNTFSCAIYNAAGSATLVYLSVPYNVVNQTWNHIALVRNGNVFTFYVNGIAQKSITAAVTIPNYNGIVSIGGVNGSIYPFPGYIDEFRITNGVARWTSNFTPPTTHYIGREDVLGRNISFPGFVKIYDHTCVAGETSLTIPVDGDTDQEYIIYTRAQNPQVRLNGDSGSNYGYQYVYDNGGTLQYSQSVNTGFLFGFLSDTLYLKTPPNLVKTAYSNGGVSSGNSVSAYLLSGYVWNNTANVTSITVFATFSANDRIVIYAKRSQ